MPSSDEGKAKAVLDWCASVVGPCKVVSGDMRFHGRAMVWRLQATSGRYYAKIHHEKSSWETEVHGYEQWAPAFGSFVPQLLAVHEEEPLALLVSELPGEVMEKVKLPASKERMAWRDAGSMLINLHNFAVGSCFGRCGRDGVCLGPPVSDATAYVLAELESWLERGKRSDYLTNDELTTVRAAQDLVPAFAGEPPVPCHRDYNPANWLVTSDGVWAGTIDFEFAYWDVRVAEFSRYPGWEWIHRADLLDAFFEGYGRALTPKEEQQLMVGRVCYALGAIVWGCENSFHGFAAEGRHALKHLAALLKAGVRG